MDQPSVFDYLDYRAYLQDLFAFRKQMQRSFSHRYFVQKAGFSSSNFLHLVITGRRNLTQKSLAKVADGFALGKREREYFEDLVFMTQAVNHEERDRHYQRMMAVRGGGEARKLERAYYEYYSNWYCPVIREVAVWNGGTLTADQIAKALRPPITPGEAEKALKLLTKLGLLRQDPEGKWQQADRSVTTGPEVRSLAVANFHREMIQLALQSIERHPPAERDVSCVTLTLDPKHMPEVKKKIAAFRKEIMEMARKWVLGDVDEKLIHSRIWQ